MAEGGLPVRSRLLPSGPVPLGCTPAALAALLDERSSSELQKAEEELDGRTAVLAARVLRQVWSAGIVPPCGLPYHSESCGVAV